MWTKMTRLDGDEDGQGQREIRKTRNLLLLPLLLLLRFFPSYFFER